MSLEGGLADTLISDYDLSNIVGRLKDVQIDVLNELRPYHEIGKRYATELRPGNIDVTGTARRAHINGAMLKLLLGEAAQSQPGLKAFATPIVLPARN